MNVLRRGAQHQAMYGTDVHEASHVKRSKDITKKLRKLDQIDGKMEESIHWAVGYFKDILKRFIMNKQNFFYIIW